MKLLTAQITKQLLRNGELQDRLAGTDSEPDFLPVVKLFTPDANCTWLLTELDPADLDTAFGLCDLGMGFPELGRVSIAELEAVKGQLGLPVERDRHFTASHTISVYADAARNAGRITESRAALDEAAAQIRDEERGTGT